MAHEIAHGSHVDGQLHVLFDEARQIAERSKVENLHGLARWAHAEKSSLARGRMKARRARGARLEPWRRARARAAPGEGWGSGAEGSGTGFAQSRAGAALARARSRQEAKDRVGRPVERYG
jgi:hypothetical protein